MTGRVSVPHFRPSDWHSTILPSVIGFTLLLAIVGATAWFGVQLSNAAMAVRQGFAVELRLGSLLSTLQDAETGQRGYLLTGDENYLAPYEHGQKAVRAELATLTRLFANQASQLDRLAQLERIVDEKLEELRATIDQRRAGALKEALASVQEGTGKRLMDRARDTIAEMRQDAGQSAIDAQARLEGVSKWLQAGIVVAFLLLMLTAAATVFRMRQQTIKVEEGREELRAANEKLMEEAVQREHLEAQMQLARERLEKMQATAALAEQQNILSGMVSALAHEINQPMTAARAVARTTQELARAPQVELGRLQANLGTLVMHIDRAAGVVRGLRDLLQSGQSLSSIVEIEGVLEDARTLARKSSAAHGIRIELDIPDRLPRLLGDRIQLQQVVLNLVRNAIEAIAASDQSDGCVRISARSRNDGATLEVSVADNGPGIDREHVLFEPMSSSRVDRLGLGLSICETIVKTHGGRIWLHSGEAGATEFRFALAAHAADAVAS